jgi:hypothetical protein
MIAILAHTYTLIYDILLPPRVGHGPLDTAAITSG